MTVPDPLSVDCQLQRHTSCHGVAMNILTDKPSPCRCTCHPKETT